MSDQQETFPRQTVQGTGAAGNVPMFFVNGNTKDSLPPVTFAMWTDGAHVQTYLTADEAANLGRVLLETATAVERASSVLEEVAAETDSLSRLAFTPMDPAED